MKITYDKNADAIYIYLNSEKQGVSGWVKKTYMCDVDEVGGIINMDFDENNYLSGIEVLDASKKLSKDFIDKAENL